MGCTAVGAWLQMSCAVGCPKLADDEQAQTMPQGSKGGWWVPSAPPVVCEKEVCCQPRGGAGCDGCPCVCKPLPDWGCNRAADEDVAESGKLLLTCAMRAQVGSCTPSVDMALKGTNEELAMEQTPACHASCPVQV